MKETLELKQDVFTGSSEDFGAIEKAISTLATASQAQFEDIKKEKWFNRVFNMLTFSHKNEIRVAEQIETVAQAQQIFVELLLRLSINDKRISQMLINSMENIQRLSEQDNYLLKRIKQLEDAVHDIRPDLDIKRLPDMAKDVLSACLFKISEKNERPSEDQKNYANAVLRYIDTDKQMVDPFAGLKTFDEDTRRRMLACCLEYIFLKDCSDSSYDEYNEFIDRFNLGTGTINEIKKQIQNTNKLRGAQGFYSKFEQDSYSDINIEDFFAIDFEVDEQEIDNEKVVEKKTVKHSFTELEQLINDRIKPAEREEKNILDKIMPKSDKGLLGKPLEAKEKKKFLFERFPSLMPKTVINITKGADYFLIFTTFAVYIYKEKGLLSGEINYCIPYKDISEHYLIAEPINGKDEKFIYKKPYGEPIEFIDKNINTGALQNLLTEIKQENIFAENDKTLDLTSDFQKLDKELRTGYYHVISCILKENGYPLAELLREVVDRNGAGHGYSLNDWWDEIANKDDEAAEFIRRWVDTIPYPYEEQIKQDLIFCICKVLQYTKQNNELTVQEKKYFPLILDSFNKTERDDLIRILTINSHLEKDIMEGKKIKEDISELGRFLSEMDKNEIFNTAGYTTLFYITVLAITSLFGPLGFIARVGLAAIPSYFYTDKKMKKNIQQHRQKICEKIIDSYRNALKAWAHLSAVQQEMYYEHFNKEIERLERLQKELSDK